MTDKQKNEDKGNWARLGHIEERERERERERVWNAFEIWGLLLGALC